MNKSDSIKNLSEALHKAQGAIKAAIKSSDNPFFRSKYADLVAVWDAARGPLQANGLAIAQIATHLPSGAAAVETILMHTSGEWISGVYPLNPAKADPQGHGAALSYAKRYALAAMLGIVTEAEDDDGETSVGRGKTNTKGEAQKAKPKWTPEQQAEAGKIRQELMELDADHLAVDLWKRCAYDQPSDVIDKLTVLLAQQRDIAAQAKG